MTNDVVLGVIKTVSADGVTILFDGEEIATKKKYKRIKSYTPQVNDRVLVQKIGGSYIVIGSVV